MKKSCFIVISLIIAGLFLTDPQQAWAQTEDQAQATIQDRIDDTEVKVLSPAEELVEMLKKRAMLKLKKDRWKKLRATKGTIGLHIGHDNNVNTDSDRQGDFYHEQYFSFSWAPIFNDYLGAEVGTWYFSDIYFENQDLTLLDNAFNASLKWYPCGDDTLEIQPGVERSYAYYPYADTSTYVEDKGFLKWKHTFWGKWKHDGDYEFAYKEYDVKQPRHPASSTDYIYGMVLEKKKHSVGYNIAFPTWAKNNFKIKTKAYKETSNDGYIEYYDVYSYKVTGEIGRSLTQKLYSKLSTAYERKNYCDRTVATAQKAEFDDVYTHKMDIYYTLKKGWTLSYSLSFKKSDSNYHIYDYDVITHKGGIYVSF